MEPRLVVEIAITAVERQSRRSDRLEDRAFANQKNLIALARRNHNHLMAHGGRGT